MAFFRFQAMVISLVVFLCSHCLEIFGFSLILSIYVFFSLRVPLLINKVQLLYHLTPSGD